MRQFIKQLADFIDDVLYPKNPVCCICQRILFVGDSGVCEKCLDHFTHIDNMSCIMCAKKLKENDDLPLCGDCKTGNYVFFGGCSSFVYDEYSEKLIWNFKYDRNKYGAKYAALLMCKDIEKKSWLNGIDIITCVPSAKDKTEERGYNQSAIIAAQISESFGINLNNELLIASEELKDQIGLSYEQRFENVKDKYKFNDTYDITDKTLLITDDVFTSGATLNECGKRLLEAGAARVCFATFASATHIK